MRVLVESGYLWMGATSIECEFETTLAELAELFFRKEDKELEKFVFNRKLYPDEFPEETLRDMHVSLEDCGMLHGSKLMAIFNEGKPLPKLKITSNDHIRDFDKEKKYIELGKQSVKTQEALSRRRDEFECTRPLPVGWTRHKGDVTTTKPGVWYYAHEGFGVANHDDATRQWKYPTQEQTDEMEAVAELMKLTADELKAHAGSMGLEYKDCILKQQIVERVRGKVNSDKKKAQEENVSAVEIAEAN